MPMPEAELVAALPPVGGQAFETLAHGVGGAHGRQLVVGDAGRVVEERHQPVAGEVLDRAAVRHDHLARGRVVLAQDAEHLFRLGRLGEVR